MLAIECNPRLHSCIVLLRNKRKETGEAFGQALTYSSDKISNSNNNNNNNNNNNEQLNSSSQITFIPSDITTPSSSQRHVYWLQNELGKLAHLTSLSEILTILKTIFTGEDALFDLHDPLPFFVMGHIQVPALLLASLRTGHNWNILNFCLGQLR